LVERYIRVFSYYTTWCHIPQNNTLLEAWPWNTQSLAKQILATEQRVCKQNSPKMHKLIIVNHSIISHTIIDCVLWNTHQGINHHTILQEFKVKYSF